MRLYSLLAVVAPVMFADALVVAGQTAAQVPAAALTIYNEDFAVARTQVPLDLHAGLNEVKTTQVTSQLEPDSVVLRDLAKPNAAGKASFRIVEQNYDAAVVNQDWMLEKYEGKTIQFEVGRGFTQDGKLVTPPPVEGKIVRAPRAGYQVNGQYQQNQPLIEVNGVLQFQLPGTPLFPASTEGLLLKPTLRWEIDSEKAQKLTAELAYITGGLNWEATYNVVEPEAAKTATEEKADVVGWVTIRNQSGTEFPEARIKLMAGDVAKIAPRAAERFRGGAFASGGAVAANGQVTQKPFDDYHLYDLHRTVSLANGETKQIEFLEASGVAVERSYLYDGEAETLQQQNNNFYGGNINQDRGFGLRAANTKVAILEEIKNSEGNHLGVPLPAGRVRLYRRDGDGPLEFIGESTINHTPTDDTVRIVSGSAFDVKGTRRQMDFHSNQSDRILDETFEIRVTNQKTEPVRVAIQEHLYRGDNWQITQKSAGPGDGVDATGWKALNYEKIDSSTIQFPVEVPAKGETTLHYAVRYTW
jgi:hypothetical protein